MATVEMMVEARIVRMRVEDGGELKSRGGRVGDGRFRVGEEKRQGAVGNASKRLAYIPVGLAGDALLGASDSWLWEQVYLRALSADRPVSFRCSPRKI